MKKLLIVGAGGYAKEVLWIVNDINKVSPTFNFLGFIDPQAPESRGKTLYGARVLGGWESLPQGDGIYFACGIGAPDAREAECAEAERRGLLAASLIHPSVIVADEVVVGEGTVISPTAVLAPGCRLGRHCSLNVGAVVGHDAQLGDFCVVSPGAQILGAARLEGKVFLGANSTVYLGAKMGAGSLLGANSFLLTNLRAGTSALGIPATRFGSKVGAGICHNQEQASARGRNAKP